MQIPTVVSDSVDRATLLVDEAASVPVASPFVAAAAKRLDLVRALIEMLLRNDAVADGYGFRRAIQDKVDPAVAAACVSEWTNRLLIELANAQESRQESLATQEALGGLSPEEDRLLRLQHIVDEHVHLLRRKLDDMVELWVRQIRANLSSKPSRVREQALTAAEQLETSLLTLRTKERVEILTSAAETSVASAQEAADVAQAAVAATSKLATSAGTDSLAVYFEELAQGESRTADRFRIATLTILVLIIVASGLLVWATWDAEITLVDGFRKALIALPAAAAAAYCGHESNEHRRRAWWSDQIRVLLATAPAFTKDLADEQRSLVWTALSERVFVHAGPVAQSPPSINPLSSSHSPPPS